MKCSPRVVGRKMRNRVRNGKNGDELGKFVIQERLKIKQLKWFGNVVRMGEYKKPRHACD